MLSTPFILSGYTFSALHPSYLITTKVYRRSVRQYRPTWQLTISSSLAYPLTFPSAIIICTSMVKSWDTMCRSLSATACFRILLATMWLGRYANYHHRIERTDEWLDWILGCILQGFIQAITVVFDLTTFSLARRTMRCYLQHGIRMVG
jgi:hypothetical protein